MRKQNEARMRAGGLTHWSTRSLERKLKFERDMSRALWGVGCRTGAKIDFLLMDITIIGRILLRRFGYES